MAPSPEIELSSLNNSKDDIRRDESSLSFEMDRNGSPEAQQEGLLTGRPGFIRSTRDRPLPLAVIVFANLLQRIKGSRTPRSFKINPILPWFENLPAAALHKAAPERYQKIIIFIFVHIIWSFLFVLVLTFSMKSCQGPGGKRPVRLSCTSRLWRSSTLCGLDGSNCLPFTEKTFAFRCPVGCGETIIISPETIGDTEYNYRTIVIGGPSDLDSNSPIYRGDSFICAAAIHAGTLSNLKGGGGVVSLAGEHRDFPAVEANGIQSLNFTSSFPLSFKFKGDAAENISQCEDPRWSLLGITLLFTTLMSIFATSKRGFFGSIFSCIYFCVALATDPPDLEDFMSVVSWAFRGFLPSVFVGLAIYHFCVRYTLVDLHAPFEKTILWLGGCWFGALSNFTLEKLPIQRLTIHDLRQPGALLTLIIITLLIIFIAIFQAWAFRIEGRLLKYLSFYVCLGLLLLSLAIIPNIDLRIHHYILALILLPGTALQTRPSLLYQGLLVGLFINGIARWGFDSILQTPTDLYGDDFHTAMPLVPAPVFDGNNSNITFSWNDLPSVYDGISVLVNDVERFRGFDAHDSESFTWTRYKEGEPEYFRFAFVKYGLLDEGLTGKFTQPGTWELDGSWTPPADDEIED